jgi:hypothetical protein
VSEESYKEEHELAFEQMKDEARKKVEAKESALEESAKD